MPKIPVLTELDLNASCQDYCNTLMQRFKRYHSTTHVACGLELMRDADSRYTDILRPIPQEVLDKFEENKKIVCSQKERFSPNLFKILEKTHFENLLPYDDRFTYMPRKEATDIFIAYAEEFHRLEQSNKEFVLKVEYLQQSIHSNIDIVNNNFTMNFEELKRDYSKKQAILENHKRELDELFVGFDDLQHHIIEYNQHYDKRCEYLEQIISKLNQDIKDIEVFFIKQTNHMENKLKDQIITSNIRVYVIIIVLFMIQYILSIKFVVNDSIQYPMLPGVYTF
jgi:hypothetical protein